MRGKKEEVQIKDVAKYAGVSPSTVSNFLNGRFQKMSSETKTRIAEALQKTAYVVHPLARGLSSGRTNTIGLVWSGSLAMAFDDLYLMAYAKAIRDCLRTYSLQLILIEEENLSVIARNVDGIILKATRYTEQHIPKLEDLGIPVVTLGRTNYPFHNQVVRVDDKKSGAVGIEYLLFLGYKNILVLKGPETLNPGFDDRWMGLTEYIATKPEINLQAIECDMTRDAGKQILSELRENQKIPEAIFSVNDETAIGIIEACNEYGLKVPDDLALIGIDDIPTLSKFIGLTTIRHPIFELGMVTAQEMVRILNCESDYKQSDRILPTQLIIRKSCGGRGRFESIERKFGNIILE